MFSFIYVKNKYIEEHMTYSVCRKVLYVSMYFNIITLSHTSERMSMCIMIVDVTIRDFSAMERV